MHACNARGTLQELKEDTEILPNCSNFFRLQNQLKTGGYSFIFVLFKNKFAPCFFASLCCSSCSIKYKYTGLTQGIISTTLCVGYICSVRHLHFLCNLLTQSILINILVTASTGCPSEPISTQHPINVFLSEGTVGGMPQNATFCNCVNKPTELQPCVMAELRLLC